MRADLKALADAIIQAVRTKIAPLVKRLDDLGAVIEGLPDAVSKDLERRVQAAVGAIPRPKDGTSVTADDVAPLIVGEVARAVQSLPVPKDGESVTVDQLAPLVQEEVAKAVERLPAPRDGKDADPEQMAALVAKAVADIPRPEDGRSITPEEVVPMLSELVSKAVAEIPRPKDGESIPAAEVQRMVDEAVTKAMGSLALPKDGEPGRDALQLELQPCIDLEKTYPRGTYAKHDGGLWRAFEATKGLHGWECVVEGIADLRIDQDGRQFTLVARTSSGAEVSKSIKVAALVDKGVFTMGDDYEAGDGVTWGGSFFIAQKDGPAGRPGEPGCDGWRLAVKRGRDGTKGVSV